MKPGDQWELVEQYRRELERDDDEAPWADIEADWQSLDVAHSRLLMREQANFAESVLPSIASWVENIGTYPPPELLLALCDMFREYIGARGSLSLEEVMLGAPKQRTGTYAARHAKRDVTIDVGFALAFVGGKHRGLSDAKAAEAAQSELETQHSNVPDAETLLKRWRRKGFKWPGTKKQ